MNMRWAYNLTGLTGQLRYELAHARICTEYRESHHHHSFPSRRRGDKRGVRHEMPLQKSSARASSCRSVRMSRPDSLRARKGWLEIALLLPSSGRSCEAWFFSVEGDSLSLEPGSLGCGGGGWLINISPTENHVIIEIACAPLF